MYGLVWIKEHNLYSHHFEVWILEISTYDINSYYCNHANTQNTANEHYLIWWLITCFHKSALRTQHIKLKYTYNADFFKGPEMILRKESIVHLQLTIEYKYSISDIHQAKEKYTEEYFLYYNNKCGCEGGLFSMEYERDFAVSWGKYQPVYWQCFPHCTTLKDLRPTECTPSMCIKWY